jgi:hypothetical protein
MKKITTYTAYLEAVTNGRDIKIDGVTRNTVTYHRDVISLWIANGQMRAK